MSDPLPHPWPDGREGAVSLTFDDGLSSQLEVAVPMLREHGLRATFYLTTRGENWRERLAPWREVARAGHEIGNHTATHPCSRNFSWMIDRGLEAMTLADIEADILEGKRRLQEAIPEAQDMSFCYPCYQDFVGAGPERQSYVPVVARHHAAGRGRGECANHPLTADLHSLSSWNAERMSGPEMVGYCERAAAQGRWTILTFHGIHQGGLSVSDADLREVLDFLRRRSSRLWVAPVIQVARHLLNWREQR